MGVDSTLLLASGAAYDINDAGVYDTTGDTTYAPNLSFTGGPVACVAGPANIDACLVGSTSSEIIVAFRGTIPQDTTLSGILDWLDDFYAEPETCGNLPGMVHPGFYDGVNLLISGIVTEIGKLQPAAPAQPLPVYVTGHSKGGGMAPLAAYMLQEQYSVTVAGVVTFAGPRCGNGDFASAYQKIFSGIDTRYENYGDIVPLCPPCDQAIIDAASPLQSLWPSLYNLIMEASTWGYTAVVINKDFIDSSFQIETGVTDLTQFCDVLVNLAWNWDQMGTALWEAHTIQPGYGYMSAVCPGIGISSTSAFIERSKKLIGTGAKPPSAMGRVPSTT